MYLQSNPRILVIYWCLKCHPFNQRVYAKLNSTIWDFEYELGAFSGAYDGISLGYIIVQETVTFQKVQFD
jgi:hypothetical protein